MHLLRDSISSQLPSNRNRSFLVHKLVQAFGLLETQGDDNTVKLQTLRPSPAQFRDLSAYHDRDYLERLLKGEVDGATVNSQQTEYGLEEDCPTFPHLPDYVRLVAGATLAAAKALKEDSADVSICWDGGRHHAQKAQASGFCYVADCVLAILTLKRALTATPERPLLKPRVMYLDFDLHFSDGVFEAFLGSSAGSSSPQTPPDPDFDPFTLSLPPLERGASNKTFHRIWPLVERVKDAFQPHYVVVQCGADGLAGDPYATWNWSLDGEGSMGWCIGQVCGWRSATLLLRGGGYNSPNVARAWTQLTSIALERPLSPEADIPDHGAFPLYAPSFTLDVPPGNIQDQNTDPYLAHVEDVFMQVAEAMRERMQPSG
ncbi:histone deacetylase complex protein [Ganoderma leucocontextum]|nr:histone deacetylase complex protein [Ganoderma leucocontextum]